MWLEFSTVRDQSTFLVLGAVVSWTMMSWFHLIFGRNCESVGFQWQLCYCWTNLSVV